MSEEHRRYKRLLTDLKVEDDTAGQVLVGSLVVGPSVERVRKLIGLPRAKVREFGRNLRGGQIWLGRQVDVSEWLSEDGTVDPISFGLNVLVAKGFVERQEARV